MPDRTVMVERARAMRAGATVAERRVWAMLRNRQIDGMKFRRQVPLGPYIADFACFDPKIIVECDGGQHAGSTYDEVRDAWFRAQASRCCGSGTPMCCANRTAWRMRCSRR